MGAFTERDIKDYCSETPLYNMDRLNPNVYRGVSLVIYGDDKYSMSEGRSDLV